MKFYYNQFSIYATLIIIISKCHLKHLSSANWKSHLVTKPHLLRTLPTTDFFDEDGDDNTEKMESDPIIPFISCQSLLHSISLYLQ